MTDPTPACPACGTKGKAILYENIFCNLRDVSRLTPQTSYHFCPNRACEVVYFDKETIFYNSDLIRPMALKSDDPEATVCYCFGYMRKDASPQNFEAFLKKLEKGCHCRIKNPAGSCCKKLFASFINL